MIFRRRRTRIEIEQTTMKLQGGVLYPFVAPPTPSPGEAALARVLPFPAPEPVNQSIGVGDLPTKATPESQPTPTTRQEMLP